MLRKIVAGVDGQAGGRDAAVLAAALAGAEGDVLLAGVYADPLLRFPPALGRGARAAEQTEQLLLAVRGDCAPRARTHVACDMFAARALRHLAEREQADALVLGSTHRDRSGRAAAGRMARQVLHDAPCPVALAARGTAERPCRLRRVVVGIDGSAEADAALAVAADVAHAHGAQLEVVAVVDERLPGSFMPVGSALEVAQWEELIDVRRGEAERLVAEATAGGAATGEVRVGEPAVELAQAAQGANLLVLGSRRWGPLARIVLGSTGEELLREAPCSLLLVPRPADVEDDAPASAAHDAALP